MPATTIKLESDLVEKAANLKAPEQSISAYVRNLIEKEYRDKRLRESAQAYEQFLCDHPDECEAMETWESAPLAGVIEPKQP